MAKKSLVVGLLGVDTAIQASERITYYFTCESDQVLTVSLPQYLREKLMFF